MKRSLFRFISDVPVLIVVLVLLQACGSRKPRPPQDAPGAPPDLIIESLSITNQGSYHVGQTVAVVNVTKNCSNAVTKNFFNLFYLCTSSNAIAGSCYWTNHPVNVGAGWFGVTTKSYTNQFRLPTVASGNWHLCAVADGSNNVVEAQEINNTNAIVITILNP